MWLNSRNCTRISPLDSVPWRMKLVKPACLRRSLHKSFSCVFWDNKTIIVVGYFIYRFARSIDLSLASWTSYNSPAVLCNMFDSLFVFHHCNKVQSQSDCIWFSCTTLSSISYFIIFNCAEKPIGGYLYFLIIIYHHFVFLKSFLCCNNICLNSMVIYLLISYVSYVQFSYSNFIKNCINNYIW